MIPLVILLAAMLWLACAVKVNAAAKKTFYVITKAETHCAYSEGGTMDYKTKYTYYKTGLKKSEASPGKSTWIYDKSGNIKEIRSGGGGKVIYKYTKKKGKITKLKIYDNSEKKTTDVYTYKKGKVHKRVHYIDDEDADISKQQITTYHSNGKPKKFTWGHLTFICDKNGYPTSRVSGNDYGYSESTTYENTYDKKGRIKQIIENTSIDDNGEKSNTSSVTTYTYKEKSGRVTKLTKTIVTTGADGSVWTDVITTKFSHKKIKIAKKYQKAVAKEIETIITHANETAFDPLSYF